jgi:hypothetical protein
MMPLHTKPLGSPTPPDGSNSTLQRSCVYCLGTGTVKVTCADGEREVKCPACGESRSLILK